jgi:hypothetical protein
MKKRRGKSGIKERERIERVSKYFSVPASLGELSMLI